MKSFIGLIVLFLTSIVYSQKGVDTILITNITKTSNYGDTTVYIKTSDMKTQTCFVDPGYKVGDVLMYFDNETLEYVEKEEYENSLYYELRGTEYSKHSIKSFPVKSVKYEESNETVFKYKVFTDSKVVYYTNYPPENGIIVFYLTEIGSVVKN